MDKLVLRLGNIRLDQMVSDEMVAGTRLDSLHNLDKCHRTMDIESRLEILLARHQSNLCYLILNQSQLKAKPLINCFEAFF